MGVAMRLGAFLLLVACSSGKPHAIEDAKHAATPTGEPVRADAAITTRAGTTGDVQVRVEWSKVPAAVRASPGATSCGTARQPQVAPSTTWGIGDVLVIVDGAPGAPAEARVRLADCALVPRLAIGSSLVVDSAADKPAKLVVNQRLAAADLRVPREESTPPRTVLLPVAGHGVSIMLDPGAAYEIATDGKDPETAWVVAAVGAVTDPSGVVLVKDVPIGTHAVRAWLPPRGGQPARYATGQVTVAAGDLAELTLALEP